MARRGREAGRGADHRPELVQGRTVPARDVHDLARELSARPRGQEVRRHDVVDEAEVSRLPTVPVDRRRLLPEGRGDELRDDGGVVALRILARTEDVEVAQTERLDGVERREYPEERARRSPSRRRTEKGGRGSIVSTFGRTAVLP